MAQVPALDDGGTALPLQLDLQADRGAKGMLGWEWVRQRLESTGSLDGEGCIRVERSGCLDGKGS